MSLVNVTRSELTKQFTTSIWWILGIVLAGYVGFTAAGLTVVFALAASGALPSSGGGLTATGVPGDVSALIYSLAASVGYVFPLLIGTLLVTGEFRHNTLTPTFLTTPKRGRVLTAKVLAGAVMGLVYAALALIVTVGPAAGILAGFGQHTGLDSSVTWAMLGRIVVAFVLWVVVGIGVGLVVRNQVAAVVIVLAFTQFVEPLLRFGGAFVSGLSDAARFLPGAASDTLVGASLFSASAGGDAGQPLEWWVGGLVLLAYGLLLTVLGYLSSWRRDVG